MAQVAKAYVTDDDLVAAPIVGAAEVAHIDVAVAALEVSLTDDDRARLGGPDRAKPAFF